MMITKSGVEADPALAGERSQSREPAVGAAVDTGRRPTYDRLMPARSALAALAVLLVSACATPAGEPPEGADSSLDFTETIPGHGVAFDMVWIEEIGCWVGRTEVTWDEFLVFCAFDDLDADLDLDGVTRPSKPLEVHPFDRHWGVGRRPAVGMSRNAAEKYCAWLSGLTGRHYRLPTEEEWRAACGPGTPEPVSESAWCSENSGGRTQEVATLEPNASGLHDMLGNLAEYCSGAFAAEEPERAVMLGGSWRTPAAELSPGTRLGFDEDWTLDDPGFPPGVWWIPDGDMLGFRLLCEGDSR